MRRRRFQLFLEFVVLSVPLTGIWFMWGKALYGQFFVWIASPLFEFLGAAQVPVGHRERFINYIPFVVLMLITPQISRRRRWIGLVAGMFVIFLGHLVFAWVAMGAPVAAGGGRTAQSYSTIFPAFLLSDSLPFLLWVIAASPFVRDVVARVTRRLTPESGSLS